MLDDVENGARNIIVGGILGVLVTVGLGIISKLPNISSDINTIISLIEVINLIGSIYIINKMEKWGIGYLVGWMLGTWVILSIGLFSVGSTEYGISQICLIIGGIVLLDKILKKIHSKFKL